MSFLVVGGGIVGLASARELLLRSPSEKVLLLEKERQIAAHQTGHNSGVIHSGIYYPPGSEKAASCREGTRLLNEFCDRHGIERRKVGKAIVATGPQELGRLEKLYEQGKAHGIPGLRLISPGELKEIEPEVSGLRALYLPEVALVDFRKVAEALRREFEQAGGVVALHHKVTGIQEKNGKVCVETERESHAADFLINCSGLYADVVAIQAGCRPPVRIVPFRGEYFSLAPGKAARVRGLVYPVPDPEFPFLGVHLTPTLTKEVTVGPNAVLALAREGYGWRNVNLGEFFGTLSYGGFWKMAGKYWRTGIFEVVRSLLKPIYLASVRKFLPDLTLSDLLPGGSGVRAQAVDPEGRLVNDFISLKQSRAVHVLNAPSPAATAALALAKRIADLVKD